MLVCIDFWMLPDKANRHEVLPHYLDPLNFPKVFDVKYRASGRCGAVVVEFSLKYIRHSSNDISNYYELLMMLILKLYDSHDAEVI